MFKALLNGFNVTVGITKYKSFCIQAIHLFGIFLPDLAT